jgi:hypothetical protein
MMEPTVEGVILHEFLIGPALFMVTVADGVVTVTGAPETADLGRNLMNRIRHVAGVVAVRDELSWPLPERSIASVLLLIRQLTGDHRR